LFEVRCLVFLSDKKSEISDKKKEMAKPYILQELNWGVFSSIRTRLDACTFSLHFLNKKKQVCPFLSLFPKKKAKKTNDGENDVVNKTRNLMKKKINTKTFFFVSTSLYSQPTLFLYRFDSNKKKNL